MRVDQDAKLTCTAQEFAKGVLQQSLVLSKLSATQLDAVVQRMSAMQCTAGQVLVQMGDKASHVVVLQHGECIAAKRAVDDATTVQVRSSVTAWTICAREHVGEQRCARGRGGGADRRRRARRTCGRWGTRSWCAATSTAR